MKIYQFALRGSIATGAMVAAAMAVPAIAQERTYQFSIPAQDMPSSLRAFARTAGQQVTFDKAAVKGKRAPALKGSYTVREGMGRLLAGSGLDASWGRSGVIVVRPLAFQSQPTSVGTQSSAVAAAAPEPEREDIVVTGSRILRSVATDSPVPIVGIDEDDLQSSGATELSEVLTDYPAVTPGLNLANSTNQINASGVSSVSLRSLGSNRTLTLIDGRRTVSNVLTSNSVSLSSIPQLFVSRVEIITGGASAIYGADAVAGVVNIITRDGYSGVRLGGRVGLSSQGDSFRGNLDFLAGERFFDDRLSVMIGGSYEKEAGVMASQRRRSLESVSYSLSADADPANQGDRGINRPALSSTPPGGRFHSSSTAGGGYFYYDANGQLARSTDLAVYGWETRPDLQFSTPRTSYIAAGKVGVELADNVEFFGHVQYSRIETETERGGAETATNSSSYGVLGEFTVGRIARDNPFVPAAMRAVTGSSGIPWRRRFLELGTYTIDNQRETWRGWAGFKGKIADNWKWELSYGYGRFHQDQIRTNLLNYDNLRLALNAEFDPAAPGDLSRVRCVDAAARAAGCVPINIFGPGSITPDAANYVRAGMMLDALVTQNVLQSYVSGNLFDLPAGPVAVAFGGEYRRDWQRSITDEVTRLGFGSASFIAEYEGNIKAREVFAETSIPILADTPFFHRLSLDLAARYGSYNIANVGTMFSYRIGGEWAPVEDVRFRGQYARAQRAPTVTNLYSPQRDDADTVVDVCDGVTAATTGTIASNCRSVAGIADTIATDGVFRQLSTSIEGPSAGNPGLKEETADTLTLGAVFTPRFVPGLSMTVDYFKIKIRDAIGSLDGDELLRECYGNPEGITDNFFCNEITRDPDGQLRRVVNRDLNLNRIQRSGVDVAVDYRFDAPQWLAENGRFDLRLLYSRLLDFKTVFDGVNGVSISNEKGQIGSWRNQGQIQLGYRDGGFRLRWKARYTGKAVDSNERLAIAREAGSNPPFLHVGDRWRHDFFASVEVPAGNRDLRLYAGVNNAFNSISPFLPSGTVSGSSQNIAGEYDVIGRYFYTGFEAKF